MSISLGCLTKAHSPFHPPCRHSKLPRSLASSLPGSRGRLTGSSWRNAPAYSLCFPTTVKPQGWPMTCTFGRK